MGLGTQVGQRLREIRGWRQLSVRAVAELSGISFGYLAQIERGEKPIENRRVLEALASTLKVSPAELTGKPHLLVDDHSAGVRASMAAVEDALTGWWLGEMPDAPSRPWQDVSAEVTRLNRVLRPEAAFTEQAVLLPRLIRDLLAAAGDPKHGRSALVGLIGAYKSAAYLAHDLGFAGLPTLAVERMRQAAEALGDPAEYADVSWRRAQLLSGANRHRQYEIATAVANSSNAYPHVRGMANLTAALSVASQGIEDTARDHLMEAAAIARQIDTDDQPWTKTDFGRSNVGIWNVAITVELGYGAKVAEVASAIRLGDVPTARQAAFWMDYGRGMLAERRYRDEGVAAILRAEKLAPQKVRNSVFVREAVAGLLGTDRRAAGGRELRGLAWRMGLAPTG